MMSIVEATSVEILVAGIEDAQEITSLMIVFNRHENIVWRPDSMIPALHKVLGESELGLILLARDRETRAVVGYSIATFGYDLEFAGRDAFITELFVESSVRGRGIGQALLDAMVEKLREHDTNAVHLVVRPENERARSLYESRGFQVSPRLMMTRRLAPDEGR